jgi:hypothetical protein
MLHLPPLLNLNSSLDTMEFFPGIRHFSRKRENALEVELEPEFGSDHFSIQR